MEARASTWIVVLQRASEKGRAQGVQEDMKRICVDQQWLCNLETSHDDMRICGATPGDCKEVAQGADVDTQRGMNKTLLDTS